MKKWCFEIFGVIFWNVFEELGKNVEKCSKMNNLDSCQFILDFSEDDPQSHYLKKFIEKRMIYG
jgi:hypothetical protein